MTIAQITQQNWTPGANGGVSGSVDTTGATFLILGGFSVGTFTSISDNKGNTWTPLTQGNVGSVFCRLWYAWNASVGSGHTFTMSGTGTFPFCTMAAFSGVQTSSDPIDSENGGTGSGITTLQPGSITPAGSGELYISGIAGNTGSGSAPTINSSFSIPTSCSLGGGSTAMGGLAYKIKTDAVAENPTWSFATGNVAARIAAFKAAIGLSSHHLTSLGTGA